MRSTRDPAADRSRCRFLRAAALFAVPLAAGCGPADAPAMDEGVVHSESPLWESGQEWRVGRAATSIGAPDGPPEARLFRVMDATRVADGRVVVANAGTGEVRIYGPDGRWVRSMGRLGEGPAEFEMLGWVLHVPPDTLLAYDPGQDRAVVFTVAGEHIETVDPPGDDYLLSAARLPDGRWLEVATTVHPPANGPREGHHSTTVHALAHGPASVDTVLTGPGGEGWNERRERSAVFWRVPFGRESLRSVEGDRVAFSDGHAYDIVVREIGGPAFRIRRAAGRRPVDASLIERYLDHETGDMSPDRANRLREVVATMPMADSVPTHSAIRLDRLGNLWVENYRLPWDDDAPRAWSVFDPAGRWLGDVVVPDGLRVFEIGDDYIAGVERDGLGVEYVRVYALEKHGSASPGR